MFFGDKMFSKILWAVATIFLLFSGTYFTIKFHFIQFKFRTMFKCLFKKNKKGEKINPIETFLLSLGGRIGVGSIAGVALSIYLGGVGSIFWMLITSVLLISNTFAETILGSLYKVRLEDGTFNGGPSYYLTNGLYKKGLGIFYAILILISYIGGFLSIQSNTITKSLNEIFPISPIIIGIVLVLITFFIIFGGIRKIINVSNKLVPLMAIIYVGLCLFIIMANISKFPDAIMLIIKEAFHFKPFIYGFLPMFIIGLQRGIFSSESGIGTGSIASCATDDNDYVRQGFIQMSGVYISILICTLTVFVIIMSNSHLLSLQNINGIEIVQSAFLTSFGKIGIYLLFISIFLFSFSTIIAGYYYGENSLLFIFKKRGHKTLILKIVTIIIVFLGSVMPAQILWDMADMMVAALAIINIYALFKLRGEIYCYYRQKCDKMNQDSD